MTTFKQHSKFKMKQTDNMHLQFQTPPDVCRYMVSLLPNNAKTVLEPTPGEGNMITAINKQRLEMSITAPKDFFSMNKASRFDCVIGNPPFSAASAYNAPEELKNKGMKIGYYILLECMKMSDNIVMLMPWFTISDSDVRLRQLKSYGMKSITALPRATFRYARIQTCIMVLQAGYQGETIFKVYEQEIKHRKMNKNTLFNDELNDK